MGSVLNLFRTLPTCAHECGYAIYGYQIRLAIEEIKLRSGASSPRPKRAALDEEAEAHGILLIAHQARELLTNNGAVRALP